MSIWEEGGPHAWPRVVPICVSLVDQDRILQCVLTVDRERKGAPFNSEDIADTVIFYAFHSLLHVDIREMTIYPTVQPR